MIGCGAAAATVSVGVLVSKISVPTLPRHCPLYKPDCGVLCAQSGTPETTSPLRRPEPAAAANILSGQGYFPRAVITWGNDPGQ
jgi:hypothetical protein